MGKNEIAQNAALDECAYMQDIHAFVQPRLVLIPGHASKAGSLARGPHLIFLLVHHRLVLVVDVLHHVFAVHEELGGDLGAPLLLLVAHDLLVHPRLYVRRQLQSQRTL